MELKSKPKIIIVDDNIHDENDDFYIVELGLIYGKENIVFFQNPTDAIEYISSNLSQRMIVLLDVMFGKLPLGFKVFEEIIAKTSLVCFIIMTGNVEKLSNEDLVKLINGHLWHIIKRDETTEKILQIVKNADNELSTRIDGALEEWIAELDEEEKNKPIYASKAGKEWTFNDLLREIREQTEEGTDIEKNIIKLTLDLITRGKRSINS